MSESLALAPPEAFAWIMRVYWRLLCSRLTPEPAELLQSSAQSSARSSACYNIHLLEVIRRELQQVYVIVHGGVLGAMRARREGQVLD